MAKENTLSVEIKVIYKEKESSNRLIFDLNGCAKELIQKSVKELAFFTNKFIDEIIA